MLTFFRLCYATLHLIISQFPFSLQAVYVTSTLPYIVLAIFFGRAVTLKGSVDGIIHMFKPEVILWELLYTPERTMRFLTYYVLCMSQSVSLTRSVTKALWHLHGDAYAKQAPWISFRSCIGHLRFLYEENAISLVKYPSWVISVVVNFTTEAFSKVYALSYSMG